MISVVIPAWNEEKTIAKAIEHALDQTLKPSEVIVVDNNSTDKTAEIARSYKGVRVINEYIQGLTPARNAGFNAAKGDIIARTDADCRVPKDWLECIQANFDAHEKLVGLSGPISYYDLPKAQNRIGPAIYYAKISRIIYGHDILIGPNFAVKRSAWKKVKDKVFMDDTIVHEDVDLSIHLSKVGEIIFDEKLVVPTSGRRIKGNPYTFFVGYAIKQIKMIRMYRGLGL